MGQPCNLVETEPGVWLAMWKGEETAYVFERVREKGDGYVAEVAITAFAPHRVEIRSQLNLLSTSARQELAKLCNQRIMTNHVDWKAWEQKVSSLCWLMVDKIRAGEPAVDLTVSPVTQSTRRWMVDYWIPMGLPTILFGDGGAGKSLLALTLAVHARASKPLGGDPKWRISPSAGVLYLDWEADAEDHRDRLQSIQKGLGVAVDGIFHRRMVHPLAEVASEIGAACRRQGIDLVVIDSIGPASGGELVSEDTAIAFFRAVRQIGVTCLCIGHVNKAQAVKPGQKNQIFGSVMFRNLTRSGIEVRRTGEEDDEYRLTFRLDKWNLLKQAPPPPVGWKLVNDGDALRWLPAPAGDEVMGLGKRLEALLQAGDMKTSDLAERSATTENRVRAMLSKMYNRNTKRNRPQPVGKDGRETIWGLRDSQPQPNHATPATNADDDPVPF